MKRVLLIFGTRPEAIKMAPLVWAMREHPQLEPVVCLTAQHREMVDQVLSVFDVRPDFDLNLMQPGQTLADLTGRMMQQLGPVLAESRPDAVLVQGDTTSTLCGGLAAFYQRIPVGHVEAGLRTGDLQAPFPEEMNRVVTTRLSNWHFAATEQNRQNLLSEDVPSDRIFVTGNTVIDALFLVRERLQRGEMGAETKELLSRFTRPLVLITGHRRESFGAGFARICDALRILAERFPDRDWVYPVHLNPAVQQPVRQTLGNLPNVHLLLPQSYEPFVALMCRAELILTDSGGVQEEAPALGKPTLVLREKTERTEGLGRGVVLVGTNVDRIVREASQALIEAETSSAIVAGSVYGDGTAARRIASHLARELTASDRQATIHATRAA